MNSKIQGPKFAVAALGALLVSGCDSITTEKEEPYTERPPEKVVLGGTITGLSSLRSVTLMNNGDSENALGFIAPIPAVPNGGPSVVPFSFGTVSVGSSYNIQVKEQPFGKTCTINNPSGTVTSTAPPDIAIVCNDSVPRFNLTVQLPTNPALFSGLTGAKVRLVTEEQIYERTVTPGQPSVEFQSSVFNATGQPNAFPWTVTATTEEDGTLNKCVITNPTGSNPTANVTTPQVGTGAGTTTPPCRFTVSGRVAYAGSTTAPAMPSPGVVIALRDIASKPVTLDNSLVAPVTVTTFASPGRDFTLTAAAKSNTGSVYDIVIESHPPGMRCIVAQTTNGTANLFRQGLVNPSSLSPANAAPNDGPVVYCREVPTGPAVLSGTYRFTNRILTTQTQPAGQSGTAALTYADATSTWQPFNFTVQNSASSNLLTLFADGTFLYGHHANASSVEHGFYEYLPGATPARIRFMIVGDGNTATTAETNGMSFFPGRLNTSTSNGTVTLPTRSLTGVQRSTITVNMDEGVQSVRRITGTFGSASAPTNGAAAPAPVEGTNPTATSTATAAGTAPVRYQWELTEPVDVPTQMTGTFVSQDHRRVFVWDYRTYYGTHIGALGGTLSMNDACFTMADIHSSSGFMTRRGSSTPCYPWNRPATGQVYVITLAESIDYIPTHATLGSAPNRTNGLTALSQYPGFMGRLPGGQTALDGRSPSPIYFHVAPAGSFFNGVDAAMFPDPATSPAATPNYSGALSSWCTGEILGLRSSLHGAPIDNPVYLCRIRAN